MSTTAETKQNHGVSQVLKNRFVQGILASALFLQLEFGFVTLQYYFMLWK